VSWPNRCPYSFGIADQDRHGSGILPYHGGGGRPSRALIIVALLALAWAWQSEFDFATESTPV
jgi:hypothetical protein